MRKVVLALVVLGLIAGGIVFWAVEPTVGGRRFLETDELVTSFTEQAPAVSRPLSPAEPRIQQTDPPELVKLALRYQPTLVTSAADRFWPVSVLDTLRFRWKRRQTCLYAGGHCRHEPPQPSDLAGGDPEDYLQYPTAVSSVGDTFLSAARALGAPLEVIREFRKRPAELDPFASAQFYFHYQSDPPPDSYRGVPDHLVSLQYWFFYPLNYLPTVKTPLKTLANPIGATLANTDYHQGDLEHVAVLLDPRTMRPRYLWMARHGNEGASFPWRSKRVQWQGDHPVVYAAFGSHATYPRCGIQRRSRTFKVVNDYVVCIRGLNYGFTYDATPLVNLDRTVWGCWQGHLGRSGRHLRRGPVGFVPYETDGPVSPLRQQENRDITC
jgi:hypothetical protein